MKITLTHQESEEIFFNSLCNGMDYILGYDIQIVASEQSKAKAILSLQHESSEVICREDILMQVLRMGGELELVDIEDQSVLSRINLDNVHDRVQTADADVIMDFINENDDAESADHILQMVFLEEIIYG